MRLICKNCNESFDRKSNNQKFCCDKCKWKFSGRLSRRIGQVKNRRDKCLRFIRRVKIFYGCEICGYKEHPAALQFDHINPAEKSFTLSQGHTHSLKKD